MRIQETLSIDRKLTPAVIIALAVLVLIPNVLSLVNIDTPMGVKLHLFQLAIFIAAIVFGPFGGTLSGLIGSIYPAMVISNPYIIVGNTLLGFFVGLFTRKGMNTVLAVILAYMIQLAWLIPSDLYLQKMPAGMVKGVVVALLISNLIWAIVAHFISKPIKNVLK
jgi:uncharacterized membrane protein